MKLHTELETEIPIVLAPMGTAVGPELCAAVSNAGGLGIIPLWRADPADVRQNIRAIRALTTRPFGVNLHLHPKWPQEERLEICIEEGVPIVSFFWGAPSSLFRRARDQGLVVMHTVGSAEEARRAVDGGANIVVAQGLEAGGHVWGTVATLPLVPAVVDAVPGTPVLAAGGIADGRGLAAALALGAVGGWIGTRFLASTEAHVHQLYRDTLFDAEETDTIIGTIFDVGWPQDAPGRTLRNKTVDAWEAAGRPPHGSRPGEGDVVARAATGDIVRYQATLPTPSATGDLEAMAMWAGQSVALVKRQQPAAEIVREIWDEARAVMTRLGQRAV